MIDIHCHLLNGVDDGSKTIEESIEIIKNAVSKGVSDIILTPHFILDTKYNLEPKQINEKFLKLKEEVEKNNIKVNLYIGNEVFIENDLDKLYQENKFNTLNNSKYLLFEFSMNNYYNGILDLLFKLKSIGIEPIIAHPERYSFIQNNPLILNDLVSHGAKLQLDLGSYYNKYGKRAKSIFTLIIKKHMASFIATDTHHKTDEMYNQISNIKKDLEKYISPEEIDDLLINNPRKIINNKNIEVDYKIIKKSIFNRFK